MISIDNLHNNTIINTASSVPSDKKISKETNASSNAPALKDKVQFSDKAKAYSETADPAKTVMKRVEEPTDSKKLLKLKNDIASGNYDVPDDVIAAAILGRRK